MRRLTIILALAAAGCDSSRPPKPLDVVAEPATCIENFMSAVTVSTTASGGQPIDLCEFCRRSKKPAPEAKNLAAEVRALREENAKLKAEVERLQKAADEMRRMLSGPIMHGDGVLACGGNGGCKIHDAVSAYDAAREGK